MVRNQPPSHVDDAAGTAGEINKERKGLWSPEEDERLFSQITRHGVSTWSSVAQLAGLRRSGKSCRLRWMNYLRPDLKKEPITRREEETIVSLQQSLGNRWSTIAARMPGRTDNDIKNYWNSRIRKLRNGAAAKAAGGRAGRSDEEEPAPAAAAGDTEVSTDNVAGTAAAAPPLPVPPPRFPVFACQLLLEGSGSRSSTTTTTTTEQRNSSSESEASVQQDRNEDSNFAAAAAAGDIINMMGGDDDFLAFDELDYPADLLMDDVRGIMDTWESELLYSAGN